MYKFLFIVIVWLYRCGISEVGCGACRFLYISAGNAYILCINGPVQITFRSANVLRSLNMHIMLNLIFTSIGN